MLIYLARAWRKLRPSFLSNQQSVISNQQDSLEVKVSDYKPQEFPKAKYHASIPPVLVQDHEEEVALGPEWFDHPELAKQPKVKAAEPEKSKPEPEKAKKVQ